MPDLVLVFFVTTVLLVVPVICHKADDTRGKPPGWRKDDFGDILREHGQIEIEVQHHPMSKDLNFSMEKNLCETCVTFAQQTIQQLLDLILKGGLVGGCSKLCTALADKTKIPFVKVACEAICTKVGIKAFVKLIEKANLDPIYFCELVNLCPVNDYGDAKITSFTVAPQSGPQGLFTFSLAYTSNNGTGTGEFAFNVKTLDGVLWGGNFLHMAAPAGKYSRSFELNAVPDPRCDPSKQPCEQWIPGQYDVKLSLCNGICGSTRPHSAIYDTAMTSFTITANTTHYWLLD